MVYELLLLVPYKKCNLLLGIDTFLRYRLIGNYLFVIFPFIKIIFKETVLSFL